MNGDFESGFTGGIGNGWILQSDGSTAYSASQDAGHQGSGQKIQITTPGSWGLFLYQTPAFQAGQSYDLSFWYKTQGGELWVQVTDGPTSQIVLSQQLADTNGQWAYYTTSFQYTNPLADQARFFSDVAGTYWIDDVLLISAQQCHPSDSDCDGCVSGTELSAFIGLWYLDSSNPTLKELIEAIGLWKRGC